MVVIALKVGVHDCEILIGQFLWLPDKPLGHRSVLPRSPFLANLQLRHSSTSVKL
jgi:hypothetical protein